MKRRNGEGPRRRRPPVPPEIRQALEAIDASSRRASETQESPFSFWVRTLDALYDRLGPGAPVLLPSTLAGHLVETFGWDPGPAGSIGIMWGTVAAVRELRDGMENAPAASRKIDRRLRPARPACHCDRCGAAIRFGSPCLLIDHRVEIMAGNTIEIQDSQDVLRACSACGSVLIPPQLREELMLALHPGGGLPAGPPSGLGWDDCHSCGAPLEEGRPYVGVNWSIAQLDWDAAARRGIITVIAEESLASLCPGCGGRLSPEWVERYTRPPHFTNAEIGGGE